MKTTIKPNGKGAFISTVNYHILEACNFGCRFCYATLLGAAGHARQPSLEEAKAVIQAIADYNRRVDRALQVKRINFAGGEPLLYKPLKGLIRFTKEKGFLVSLITNGSLLTKAWFEEMHPYIDLLGLSLDSIDPGVLRISGRMPRRGSSLVGADKARQIAAWCDSYNIPLKINTVVHRYNLHETLANFIRELNPIRWKLLQVTPIEEQNDAHYEEFRISEEEFMTYVERNRAALPIHQRAILVAEPVRLLQGSYLMVNPEGLLFGNIEGKHRYSRPILEAGFAAALSDIKVSVERFINRGGHYHLPSRRKTR